ncbi:MAG: hypothetical protein IT198_04185 [Acidimicrobiia bacterium]|nr:hypothetical protein [Acidimicrobiia bacterium]
MASEPTTVPVHDASQLEAVVQAYVTKGWHLTFRGLGVAVLLRTRSFRGDQVVAVTLPGAPWRLSDDGQWWWDEPTQSWKGCGVEIPPGVLRSGDGGYWWDGYRWRAAPEVDVDSL